MEKLIFLAIQLSRKLIFLGIQLTWAVCYIACEKIYILGLFEAYSKGTSFQKKAKLLLPFPEAWGHYFFMTSLNKIQDFISPM